MTKSVRMNSYQAVGKFLASDLPLCYGGQTTNRKLAEERLLDAKVYAATRLRFGGQPMQWEIESSTRRAANETADI